MVIFLTMNLILLYISYTVHFRRRSLWVSHIYVGIPTCGILQGKLIYSLSFYALSYFFILVWICNYSYCALYYISVFISFFCLFFEFVDIFHLTSIFDIFVGSLLIENFLTLGYYTVFQTNFSPALYSAISSSSPGLCYQKQIPKKSRVGS